MPRLRRGLVAAACVGMLALPLPVQAQQAPSKASAAVIDTGLAPFLSRLRQAQARSDAAEADRRADENIHAEAVVVRMVAAREVAEARHALAIARIERVDAERELATEQEILAGQVVGTYRFGGPAARAEMAWRVLTESTSPLEAARSMDELGSVVAFQSDLVAERRATVERALRVERREQVRFDRALADLATARHLEEQALLDADADRTRSIDAERALLAVIGRLFDAEDRLIAGGNDPAAVVKASGWWLSILPALKDEVAVRAAVLEGADAEPEEPVAMTDRKEWLENRRAALQRDVALSRTDRRLREDWTCPLAYGAFSNDWHYPRSHGRRHKGLDMFSTQGTPIVAIQSGFVVTRDETDQFNGEHDLGGVTVTIATRPEHPWRVDAELLPDDANEPTEEWYYAHLDAIAEGMAVDAWVEAGQVIGYVGDTGNARGTEPHLHLGWQVGNRNVNPHPSIAVACHERRPLR